MKFIFELSGKIFKIMFLSVFFIIGLILLTSLYITDKNYSYFKNMPEVNDFSPGKIVKLNLVPDSDYIVNSDYSGTPCLFSKIEFIKYYSSKHSSGTIEKTIIKPDYIVMKNQNNRYLLNLKDLKPRMLIDTQLFFLKDKTTGKYNQTSQTDFRSGDEIIKESLILPSDNITVFGKLVNIKNHPEENLKELQFYGENLSFSAESFIKIAKNLPDYLANNKLIFYTLSTKNTIDTQKDMGMTNIPLPLGAFFILVPGIFILIEIFSIFALIASLFQFRKQEF